MSVAGKGVSKLPQRSNWFQRMIASLHAAFADSGVSVAESAMLLDVSSGKKREVDVLVSGKVGDIEIAVGIECRDWKTKADQSWVESMKQKHDSIPAIHKTILVSRSGFTNPALTKCEHFGIEALCFQENGIPDWANVIRRIAGVVAKICVISRIRSVTFVPSDPCDAEPAEFGANPILRLTDGGDLGTVYELVHKHLASDRFIRDHKSGALPEQAGTITATIQLPDGTYLLGHDHRKVGLQAIWIDAEYLRGLHAIEFTKGRVDSNAVAYGESAEEPKCGLLLSQGEDGSVRGVVRMARDGSAAYCHQRISPKEIFRNGQFAVPPGATPLQVVRRSERAINNLPVQIPDQIHKLWLRPYEIYRSDVRDTVCKYDAIEWLQFSDATDIGRSVALGQRDVILFWRRFDNFFGILVQCRREGSHALIVESAFRVPRQVFEAGSSESPLAILRTFTDSFGAVVTCGAVSARLILAARIRIPETGGAEFLSFSGGSPGHEVLTQTWIMRTDSYLYCSLAFGIDETEYRRALGVRLSDQRKARANSRGKSMARKRKGRTP